jgi:CIC family chloride channel protein
MFFPEILGLGTNSVVNMLSGNFTLSFVMAILILKILMTGICLGFGLFGGVFSPALFVGTATGSILGKFFTIIGFTGAGTILPFCGMAAIGGAIIGAPISAVLIILEITGSYELGLATMASVAGCCLITHLFFGHSFFDRQLMDRGINVHLGRGHLKLMAEPVNLYVSNDFCSLEKNLPAKVAIKKLLDKNLTEGYILDSDNTFLGKVLITDLIKNRQKFQKSDSLNNFFLTDPLVLNSDLSVLQSIEACRTFVGESIPVVDINTNHFEGVISEADLFSAYLDLDKQIKDLESG